jgi:hypothetical protein
MHWAVGWEPHGRFARCGHQSFDLPARNLVAALTDLSKLLNKDISRCNGCKFPVRPAIDSLLHYYFSAMPFAFSFSSPFDSVMRHNAYTEGDADRRRELREAESIGSSSCNSLCPSTRRSEHYCIVFVVCLLAVCLPTLGGRQGAIVSYHERTQVGGTSMT